MSKQQLETAKLMAKMLKAETRLPYDFPFDLVDWLVEQAERVQELEQQIRRYQEALEAIAYFDDKEEGGVATRIDVKYIARKALEGEEIE